MAITRYENVKVSRVVNSIDTLGQQTTSINFWFETRGLVANLANSLTISEKYRVYSDLMQVTFNYTPNMRDINDNANAFSLNWRGFDWRITNVRESNDRMTVTFICYRNDPTAPV
jgi:hypothetical protein